MSRAALLALLGLCAGLAAACEAPAPLDLSGPTAEWPEYAGDKGGLHWSPLTQITRENVRHLELAWEYRHGDRSDGSDGTTRTSFNATPIVADGAMYFCTGYNRVIALDPESGRERWAFDPGQRARKLQGPYPRTCRGVAYWRDPDAAPGAACAQRIFTGTIDAELIAIDAQTGLACQDFGAQGRVPLRDDVGAEDPTEYYVTSPPLVIRGRVVVGALIADNLRRDAPSGVVRAFDARTGKLSWNWDPVPPGWTPPESWPADGRRCSRTSCAGAAPRCNT